MNWNVDAFVNRELSARGDCFAEDGTHVAILMGLFNGAAALTAQLESYGAQSHKNWSLIVSDDGSSDASRQIISRFAGETHQKVSLRDGPGQGFAQNFLSLIAAAGPSVPFAALSDQDDVWLARKLERALRHMSGVKSGVPALYVARTIICDDRLRPLRNSPLFARPPSFENALVQSIGGGNTMVLNRPALDLVQDTARYAQNIVAHDWWIYQIISGAGGRVMYDSTPSVLYRQHSGNLIGANDTITASAARIAQLFRGRFKTWNIANLEALTACAHWLTPTARETLGHFANIRGGTARSRWQAMKNAGIYRQTRKGDLALKMATLLNRA